MALLRKTPGDASLQLTEAEIRAELPALVHGENVVLLGAPRCGKTRLLSEAAGSGTWFVLDLGTVKPSTQAHLRDRYVSTAQIPGCLATLKDHDVVVIDDFYKVYLECEQRGTLEDLASLLTRFHSRPGLLLATTPYRWEWLLARATEDARRPSEGGTVAGHHAVLDALRKLPHAPRLHVTHESDARNTLARNCGKGESVADALKRCRYQHEFHGECPSPGLSGHLYTTFAPIALLEPLAISESDEHIAFPRDQATFEFASHSWWEGASEFVSEAVHELGPKLLLGLGFVALPLAIGGAAFEMFKKRKAKADREVLREAFGDLLKLTALDLERVERDAGLPPCSLFSIREILTLKPMQIEQLRQVLAGWSGLERAIERHEEHFARMEKDVQSLRAQLHEIGPVSEHVNELVLKSADPDVDAALDPQGYARAWGLLKPGDRIRTVGRDDDLATIAGAARTGTRLIVLRGPGGIGKTTVAVEVANRLRDEGWFVGVPRVNGTEHLPYRLKAARSPSRGVALFTEFGYGPNALNRELLESCLEVLASGDCDVVVVVCRDSMFPVFDGLPSFSSANLHLEPLFRGRLIHDLEPMEVAGLVRQVGGIELESPAIAEVQRVSGGNPLVAVLATQWLLDGNELGQFSANDFLRQFVDRRIWRELQRGEDRVHRDQVREAYKWIALRGVVWEPHLAVLMGSPDRDSFVRICDAISSLRFEGELRVPGEAAQPLRGYRIRPDVIADLVLEMYCLPDIDNLLQRLYDCKCDAYLPGIASRIAELYRAAWRPGTADATYDKIMGAIAAVWQTADACEARGGEKGLFGYCVLNLFDGGVPFQVPEQGPNSDPSGLAEALVDGAGYRALHDLTQYVYRGEQEVPPAEARAERENVLINFLATATPWGGHYAGSDGNPRGIEALAGSIGQRLVGLRESTDPGLSLIGFLEAVYGARIAAIALSDPVGFSAADQERWITAIVESAQGAGDPSPPGLASCDPVHILSSGISAIHRRNSRTTKAETATASLEKMFWKLATRPLESMSAQPSSLEGALVGFYGGILWDAVRWDSLREPTKLWTDLTLERFVARVSEHLGVEAPTRLPTLLHNVFGYAAVSLIANQYPDEDGIGRLQAIERRALEAIRRYCANAKGDEETADLAVARFYENLFVRFSQSPDWTLRGGRGWLEAIGRQMASVHTRIPEVAAEAMARLVINASGPSTAAAIQGLEPRAAGAWLDGMESILKSGNLGPSGGTGGSRAPLLEEFYALALENIFHKKPAKERGAAADMLLGRLQRLELESGAGQEPTTTEPGPMGRLATRLVDLLNRRILERAERDAPLQDLYLWSGYFLSRGLVPHAASAGDLNNLGYLLRQCVLLILLHAPADSRGEQTAILFRQIEAVEASTRKVLYDSVAALSVNELHGLADAVDSIRTVDPGLFLTVKRRIREVLKSDDKRHFWDGRFP